MARVDDPLEVNVDAPALLMTNRTRVDVIMGVLWVMNASGRKVVLGR